jgi:hypothetical protein
MHAPGQLLPDWSGILPALCDLLGASVPRIQASGEYFLAALVTVGFLVCIDLENGGPVNANAFELQFDPKTDSLSEKHSIKGQVGDPDGWLTLKLDGTVWDMGAPGVARSYDPQMFNSVPLMAEPAPLEWNQLSAEKSAVSDTRATLGVLDDRCVLHTGKPFLDVMSVPRAPPRSRGGPRKAVAPPEFR